MVATALEQGWTFLERFAEVTRDGLEGRRIEALTVAGIDLAAAAAGGGAIAFVSYVASVLQAGGTLTVPGWGLQLAQDDLLLVSALVLFVLLTFAAAAGYYSVVRTRAIARAYHRSCARRMLEALQSSNARGLATADLSAPSLQMQVNRNSLHRGKSLETIVLMIKPVCYMAVGLAMVLYLDAALLGILAPAFLILLPAAYIAARQIDRDARAYFQVSARELNQVVRPILDGVRLTSAMREGPAILAQSYERNPSVDRFFDDFDGLQLADDKMTLVTGSFKGLFLAIVFLIVGYSVLREGGAWGHAIALLGAFALLLNSLQSLSGLAANLQRFYPQVTEYDSFYEALSPAQAGATLRLPPEIEISARRPILSDGQATVCLAAGRALLLCVDKPIDRESLTRTIAVLAESSGVATEHWSDFDFVSRSWRYFDGSLLENLTAFLPSQERRARVGGLLAEMELAEAVDGLPQGLDTRLDEALWDSLSCDLRAAVRLIPLTFTSGPIVFVDGQVLSGASQQATRSLLAAFGERRLVLTFRYDEEPPIPGQDVVVLTEDTVAGSGSRDWLQALRPIGPRLRGSSYEGRASDETDESAFLE